MSTDDLVLGFDDGPRGLAVEPTDGSAEAGRSDGAGTADDSVDAAW